MIRSLIGRISAVDVDIIDQKTSLRFKNRNDFVTPEALIIHEQKIISDERLMEACQQEYNQVLVTPPARYVPDDIINKFADKHVVILDYDVANSTIHLGTIPEFKQFVDVLYSDVYTFKIDFIPIYYYVELYSKQFGEPDFLSVLPVKDKWDFIVQEAIELGASDITVTNTRKGAVVYYNARKTKVMSKRTLAREDVGAIISLLASSSKATIADDSAKPRFFSIDINKQNRGRVVVNRTMYGQLMTIRVLSNDVIDMQLEDLHINPKTCQFIREVMLSPEKGLRLFIGETMSGKNTTILCSLCELVRMNTMKIVSLEQPVEILVDGIEQINAETDEEFEMNADSLLRQNPDIIYFTEITERTSKSVMKSANTAKAVWSSVHANSIADVLFRLQDITGMPLDRLILTMHSCVYQELVRNPKNDTITPYNRCVYFSDDLKTRLFGKDIAEVRSIIAGEEKRWGT